MRMLKVVLMAGALAGVSLTGAIAAPGGGMSSMPSDTGPRYDPAEEYAKAVL